MPPVEPLSDTLDASDPESLPAPRDAADAIVLASTQAGVERVAVWRRGDAVHLELRRARHGLLQVRMDAEYGERLVAWLLAIAELPHDEPSLSRLTVATALRRVELLAASSPDGVELRRLVDADDAELRSQDARSGRVGPYLLLRPLGRGGMGVVYRAVHERLGRPAAIKVLAEERALRPQAARQLEREARAASRLDHPGVVQVYDFGESIEHGPYIALQLVEAPTLRERLGEGELPLLEALRIAADVGRTLQAAHDARVVHGDLKPENIFLLPGGRTKLADFGAAVFLDERSGTARTRVRLGTPPYMAPEQIAQRAIDGRTDVYGLGCVLHEMLTGDVPFGRVDAPAELLRRQLESLPPRLPTPSFPSEVQRLLDRCLAKERADRHVSAEAFARAAERLADGLVHDAERG